MPTAYSVPASILENVESVPAGLTHGWRAKAPTIDEDMRADARRYSPLQMMAHSSKRKLESMGHALQMYWADLLGDTDTKQKVWTQEHLAQMHDRNLEKTHPGSQMMGRALAEMTVPNPYWGSRIVPTIVSGLAQSGVISALDPSKSKEDVVTDMGVTGAAQLGVAGLAKLGMPGVGPTVRSKLTPESKKKLTDLEAEGFRFLRGTRAGLPASTVEDQLRDLSTTAAGRRAFEPFEAHNQAVADKIATRSIGSTADRPTEQVMLETRERLGREFEDLFGGRSLQVDDDMWDQMTEIAEGGTGPGRLSRLIKRHPDVQNLANRILETVADDLQFEGADVQRFLRKINKKANDAWKKGESDYAEGMDALGEVILEWAGRTGGDEDFLARLNKVKNEYANWKTLVGKINTEGSVDVPKVARELEKKAGDLYVQGKSFSGMDPLRDYSRYAARAPTSSGIMQRGRLGNIVGGAAPYIKPRYWWNRGVHTGLLQSASPNLPGILSNIAGYAAARPDVGALLGYTALGGIGAGGVALEHLLQNVGVMGEENY